MKVSAFARKVTLAEGKKKQISIAQVNEVLRIVNCKTKGLLYAIIRWLPVILILAAPAMGWGSGPQGPAGPAGPAGPQGPVGATGAAGEDASNETAWVLGGDVRMYDGQHMAMHFFNDYNLRERRNWAAGVRFAFKVGKSWEETQIEKLSVMYASGYNAMTEELAKRDAEIGELKFALNKMKQEQLFTRGRR